MPVEWATGYKKRCRDSYMCKLQHVRMRKGIWAIHGDPCPQKKKRIGVCMRRSQRLDTRTGRKRITTVDETMNRWVLRKFLDANSIRTTTTDCSDIALGGHAAAVPGAVVVVVVVMTVMTVSRGGSGVRGRSAGHISRRHRWGRRRRLSAGPISRRHRWGRRRRLSAGPISRRHRWGRRRRLSAGPIRRRHRWGRRRRLSGRRLSTGRMRARGECGTRGPPVRHFGHCRSVCGRPSRVVLTAEDVILSAVGEAELRSVAWPEWFEIIVSFRLEPVEGLLRAFRALARVRYGVFDGICAATVCRGW
jgi:hypothetical protein